VHVDSGNENPGAPRPLKIDDDTADRIRFGFLESGTEQGAAKAAGVNRSTLRRWINQGKNDIADGNTDTPFANIVQTINGAKDELVAELASQVQANAIRNGDTRTMLKLLAVLDPDVWAERKEIRHGGAEGAPPIAVTGPPPMQVVHVTLGADIEAEAEAIARGEG
jgi:hypothetical protein